MIPAIVFQCPEGHWGYFHPLRIFGIALGWIRRNVSVPRRALGVFPHREGRGGNCRGGEPGGFQCPEGHWGYFHRALRMVRDVRNKLRGFSAPKGIGGISTEITMRVVCDDLCTVSVPRRALGVFPRRQALESAAVPTEEGFSAPKGIGGISTLLGGDQIAVIWGNGFSAPKGIGGISTRRHYLRSGREVQWFQCPEGHWGYFHKSFESIWITAESTPASTVFQCPEGHWGYFHHCQIWLSPTCWRLFQCPEGHWGYFHQPPDKRGYRIRNPMFQCPEGHWGYFHDPTGNRFPLSRSSFSAPKGIGGISTRSDVHARYEAISLRRFSAPKGIGGISTHLRVGQRRTRKRRCFSAPKGIGGISTGKIITWYLF